MLQELPVHQRADAVSSLVYEANARARDPVYGCVGAITYLQDQVAQLQMQLAVAQAEILCIQMHQDQLDQDQPPVYVHQSPIVGAHHPFSLLMHEDQASACSDDNNNNNNKSFLIQNNQVLNFSASSGNHVLYQEPSFKKEAIYGHDMVS
ncbi:LOB domain-containing protein 12 [Striga hermonthica]|uniref:LOB domain-containing protein 12 n=1 Tax=Striga hermonthica TaxID=68872 RepID=A0A9N7NB34_STRHE|nr:LOB domain-containing protein 12 [Striga hermonthica]